MRINRRWILGAAISLLPVLPILAVADSEGTNKIRWDIIHIAKFDPHGNVIEANGKASASAQNKSMMTMTGSGTFTVGDSDDVTGGGTWQIVAPPPESTTTRGSYRVTGLVRFDLAPGAQTSNVKDHIGTAL